MRLITLTLLLGSVIAVSAGEGTYMAGDIHVMTPWSRALPAVSENGAAYLTIMNTGSLDDRLASVATPIAKRAELHTQSMSGTMMMMRRIDSLALVPGKYARLEPGGTHIMLVGLQRPLVEGETFPLTLNFEKAGSIEVEVRVHAMGATGVGHGGHAGHAEHGEGHGHQHQHEKHGDGGHDHKQSQ